MWLFDFMFQFSKVSPTGIAGEIDFDEYLAIWFALEEMGEEEEEHNEGSENIALLGATLANETEDTDNSGVIVGSSLAVLGAAAAIYAIRRCKK